MTLGALVPDVVIGGAPRAGTTFLCELLGKHPQVFIARPFIPEPKVLMTPHPDGVSGYGARYAALFKDAAPGSLLIEKTSYYLENDDARGRFVAALPQARILFILRDPVERAYSNWLWSKKNGLETLSFSDAIAFRGDRACPLPPERSYARPFDYLARGAYGKHLAAWMAAIGPQRIGVFQFEDAVERPEAFVRALQDFVGVAPLPWSRLETGVVNATERDGGGVDPQVARAIRDHLAQDMSRLRELTDIDVARWGF